MHVGRYHGWRGRAHLTFFLTPTGSPLCCAIAARCIAALPDDETARRSCTYHEPRLSGGDGDAREAGSTGVYMGRPAALNWDEFHWTARWIRSSAMGWCPDGHRGMGIPLAPLCDRRMLDARSGRFWARHRASRLTRTPNGQIAQIVGPSYRMRV